MFSSRISQDATGIHFITVHVHLHHHSMSCDKNNSNVYYKKSFIFEDHLCQI